MTVETVGLFKTATLRIDLNVRPIYQDPSQRNHPSSTSSSADWNASGTSKWTGEWSSPMGKKHRMGLLKTLGDPPSEWAILLCSNPQVCEESRPDTKKLCWFGQIKLG